MVSLLAGKTSEMTVFMCSVGLYGDGAGNAVEENSGVFSLIQMC